MMHTDIIDMSVVEDDAEPLCCKDTGNKKNYDGGQEATNFLFEAVGILKLGSLYIST